MKKDTHKTDVIFRVDKTKDFENTIFALFPHIKEHNNSVLYYQHIGQHSTADYDHCIKTSKLATENEYKNLFIELESIGYNLNVIKKRNYKKYLHS